MKIFLFVLLSLFFYHHSFSSGANSGDTLYIVIGIPDISDEDAVSITNQLKSSSDISVIGYCSNSDVFILKGTSFKNEAHFLETCQQILGSYTILRKSGSISKTISECSLSGARNEELLKELSQ